MILAVANAVAVGFGGISSATQEVEDSVQRYGLKSAEEAKISCR